MIINNILFLVPPHYSDCVVEDADKEKAVEK